MRRAITAVTVLCAAGGGAGGAIAIAAASPSRQADSAVPNVRVQGDARIQGRFAVTGKLTAAVNVGGEYRGERLTRTWTLRSGSCRASECTKLVLIGGLAGGPEATVALSHIGAGRYRGSGSFFAAQRCQGRTVRDGRRVAYVVNLTVTRREVINGLSYATGISAGYTNPSRSNRTTCPLKPAHDAATFTATVESGLPVTTTGPVSRTGPVTTISSTPSPTRPTETVPHAPTPQGAAAGRSSSAGPCDVHATGPAHLG